MRYAFDRLIGVILIVTAIFGILFSLIALIGVWIARPQVISIFQGNMHTIQSTLDTTATGLDIAGASLSASIASITTLEATVQATGKSINDTTPMLETLVILTQEDLPNTVSSTQLSLVAAQDSAQIIDGMLSFLNSLPLVPPNLYNPPVPLHIALRQVSDSMENLPTALVTIESSLTATSSNLETIETDIHSIAGDIHEINLSMVEAQSVIQQYHELVADLQQRAERTESRIPGWINSLALILTFIFVWMGVSQIGLILQGLDRLETRQDS